MNESILLVEEYVTTQPGEPYRLFPFGVIYKGGKRIDFTRELAERCRLPHFKPPIKLGSHEETTPAGGSIVALEVRDDGLYAVPEYTDKGLTSLTEGAYRYHSPEILWKGGYEDPATGKVIEAPLIIGDALLHTPHLGEAAALYTVEPFEKEHDMSDTVELPKTLWEKIEARLGDLFGAKPAPEQTPTPPVVTPPVEESEEFKAAVLERDQARQELDAFKAEQAKAAQFSALVTDLQNKDAYGSMYIEVKNAEEAAGMMGGMTPEQREWCMRTFKAYAAAAKEGEKILRTELGSAGAGAPDDPRAALDLAAQAYAAEHKTDYPTALAALAKEKPELFGAYVAGKEK